MKKEKDLVKWGSNFGKSDTDRVGLFAEMPYMNGAGYVSPFAKFPMEKGLKGLVCPGSKKVCGTQHGLFETRFKRIFEGEAITRVKKPKGGIKDLKRMSDRPFISAGFCKKHSTPGDYYGTFGGKVKAFSPVKKTVPKSKPQNKNFVTGPGKKGGPGYIDITIGKYPLYIESRYGTKERYKKYGHILDGPMRNMIYPVPFFNKNPYTEPSNIPKGRIYIKPKEKKYVVIGNGIIMPVGPGKKPGGCKAGCFQKFPSFIPDRYQNVYEALKPPLEKKVLYPIGQGNKSYYYRSVINQNVDFKMNIKNYTNFEPTFLKYIS